MNILVAAAALIDASVGDPPAWPHPVRAFGALIARGEPSMRSRFPATPAGERVAGALLAGSVMTLAFGASWLVQRAVRRTVPHIAFSLEAILAASTLATRDLLTHVGRVERSLQAGNIVQARVHLSHIVGRDTAALDAGAIAGAAIETLAESLCDGIVAPLFYLSFGGLPFAMLFKAVSTLDSMIGHREAPYTTFGSFAARCDDALNFIPARIAALTLTGLAPITQGSSLHTLRCIYDDANSHPSINAGYPETAMAAALGVRLGGAVTYDGVHVERPVLNARGNTPSLEDLHDAISLVALAATAFSAVCAVLTRER